MLMEIMGLHLPGSAFIPPNTALREALTRAAAQRALRLSAQGDDFTPLAEVISEKTIVNGIVGLLATGGSTNHTLHLVAIARAAGIAINWDDFSELSRSEEHTSELQSLMRTSYAVFCLQKKKNT